jgi:ABC-type transport system substrate-binding protein
VPIADLSYFDPIWSVAGVARDAGLLVWDTLYGVDAKLQPQRQMVEAEEVSPDGLTWTFQLRPGLKFHDGEPVLAKDAAFSSRLSRYTRPLQAQKRRSSGEHQCRTCMRQTPLADAADGAAP